MRWEDLKRYQVIEALLLWEGRLNARQLMDYFDTSRASAQKYISDYKKLHPNGFEFVSNERSHIANINFLDFATY